MKHVLKLMQRTLVLSLLSVVSCYCLGQALPTNQSSGKKYRIVEKVAIEPVWSATRVGFSLLTYKNHQFVAYFDMNRQMTVAQRTLDSKEWKIQRLPSYIGWDSHNYITMGLDKEGYLHVSGNMHAIPLIYFRASQPYDVFSLERVPSMVGKDELKVTYPVFLRNKDNDLIYNHRYGTSGNGRTHYNIYDAKAKKWSRLLDQPILDGEGLMNAYSSSAPVLGPDGYYHLTWIWRDSPMAETNHDLSYAKSKDLVNWFTADDKPLSIPITYDTKGVIVDPVPAKQGMLNGNGRIGFDSKGRVLLAYHKFEDYKNPNSPTQIYIARLENKKWKIYKVTDWDHRWYFSGGNTLTPYEVNVGEVVYKDGELKLSYGYKGKGSGLLVLSEETLQIKHIDTHTEYPDDFRTVRSKFPKMGLMITANTVVTDKVVNTGASDEVYFLRHETLPINRDEAWPEPWPEPSMLELYKFIEVDK